MNVSNQTLIKVAIYGGLFVSATGVTLHYLLQRKIRESKCYQEAYNHLLGHSQALKLLGEPVKPRFLNISNTKQNGEEDGISWFTIPIKGQNASGLLRYYTARKDDSIEILKIELQNAEFPDKKIIIKDGVVPLMSHTEAEKVN